MKTTAASGGGSVTRTVTVAGQVEGPWRQGVPTSWYTVGFKSGITKAEQNVDSSTDRYSGETAVGQISTGKDSFTGSGEIFVADHGGPSPTPMDVSVDGRHITTLKEGESVIIAPDGSVTERSSESLPSGYDAGDNPFTPADAGEQKAGLGGFLSLIPGVLPSIGPLTSSQTTAVAIVVAIAIAGTVLR